LVSTPETLKWPHGFAHRSAFAGNPVPRPPIPVEHVNIVLILLVAGFAVAVVVALVRGLTAFFKDAEHIRAHGSPAAEAFGVKQNRMMAQRVFFQGIAILLIVLLGSLAS
jgi:hypothetical protein